MATTLIDKSVEVNRRADGTEHYDIVCFRPYFRICGSAKVNLTYPLLR